MSLTGPSHGTDNAPRPFNLYWCYHCLRTVRVASEIPTHEMVCPRCFQQFLLEINMDMLLSPEAPLLAALSILLDQPIWPANGASNRLHLDNRPRLWALPDRLNPEADPQRPRNLPPSWIIPRQIGPPEQPEPLSRPDDDPVPRNHDPRNYFGGPGWDALVEELTQNDRPGPPPAPEPAIDSIPTIKITSSHLTEDSDCPVCKEEFQVGGDVKELPCKHIYHAECIYPWLRLHNSCPVCRQQLPVPNRNNDDSHSSNAGRGRGCFRLIQLRSLRPFRPRVPTSTTDTNRASQRDRNTRVSSCIIL